MDPFDVLGLTREASIVDIRAARRRLALTAHPDVGGSQVEMQQLNAAFEAAVAHATGRRLLGEAPASTVRRQPGSTSPRSRSPQGGRWQDGRRQDGRRQDGRWQGGRQRVEHDVPSFTIDALPVEAFEALLVVASWIGEVAVDEPPYVLEARLDEPEPCWCRLDLVPDAGGTTVSLTVVFDGPPLSESEIGAEQVRDTWVAHLNQLGRLPD